MIKLIASDMDGTLLPHFGDTVDPEVYDIIKKLKKQGILFLAASGRQYPNLMREFEPVKHEINYLCENGCLVMHNRTPLLKEIMPQEIARELLQTILDRKGYRALVSGESTSYILKGDPDFYYHLHDEVRNEITEVDDLFAIGEPYFKISAYQADKRVAEAELPWWKSLYPEELTCVYGGNGYVDFTPPGVGKGSAITKYMEYLGITKDEVMAFGDNYNDETMLQSVTYSFAMENAPQDIKDICYGTTANVKETLKEFFAEML